MPSLSFPNLVRVEAAWGLLVIPVLMFVWWYARSARKRVLQNWTESIAYLPAKRGWGRFLLVLLVVALVAALAGPEWGTSSITPTSSARDLFVIVDVSQSMLAEDQPPRSRLVRAKEALVELLDHLDAIHSTARVGLIVFAGNARLLCPPTEDRAHVLQLIRDLSTESLGSVGRLTETPGSAIGTSLGSVLQLLSGWAKQAPHDRDFTDCLILTDGDDLNSNADVMASMKATVPYRIHSYAVGDAGRDWPIPQGNGYLMVTNPSTSLTERALTRRHDELLRQLTSGTLIVENNSPKPLVTWWKKEMADLPTRILQSQTRQVPVDRAAWFLGLAGLLTFIELAWGGARRREW